MRLWSVSTCRHRWKRLLHLWSFLRGSLELMKLTFALLCFLTLISRGWTMDDEQMSQLLVGTWESVDDSQQAITGPAHMVFDFTYYRVFFFVRRATDCLRGS